MKGIHPSLWGSGRLLLALALALSFFGERPLSQGKVATKALFDLAVPASGLGEKPIGLPIWGRPNPNLFPISLRPPETLRTSLQPGAPRPRPPYRGKVPSRPSERLFLLYRHLLLEGG
ncbi:MAG: hypothetical protein C4298_04060 [Thermus sp.]